MIEASDFLKLRKDLERAVRDEERIKGVLQQQQKQLQDEFGCANTEEAEALIEQLEEEAKTLEQKLEQQLEELRHDGTGTVQTESE